MRLHTAYPHTVRGGLRDEAGHGEFTPMDLLAEHCAHLARLNRRPRSIDQRRWCLLRLQRWIHPTPLIDASLPELRSFVERSTLGVETTAAETSHVVQFYRWLCYEELRVDDPTVRLERPTRTHRNPRPMADDRVSYTLLHAPEPVRAWFHLAAYCGLRACEVGPLRGEDVLADRIIIREQKGGDEGAVPKNPTVSDLLDRLPAKGWLFPHRGHGPVGPTSAGQVSRHANLWLHDHGIPDTFHSLRHWYGTQLLRKTGNLRLVQELMRHRSIASTVGYTDILSDEKIAAVNLLPVFGLVRAA